MKLEKYINQLQGIERFGNGNPEIESITFDSRKAAKGVIFVAMQGTNSNGHDFIPAAIEAGAPVIVCEKIPEGIFPNTTFLKVKNSAETLGYLANIYYNYPSHKLELVGVTGTNGKTTIATLLYRLALEMGYKAGLISTIANYINGKKFETNLTTPDALILNSLMSQMIDQGCDYCFMEASSHAIAQKRITGLKFRGGVFTNLSHDHLDYHGTFDNYLKTKKSFFDNLEKEAFALVNLDDRNGEVMIQNTKAQKYTYSIREIADFKTKIIESIPEGMALEIAGKELWTPLIGKFNVSNLTAIYGVAELLGWEKDEIIVKMSKLTSVEGRCQTIRSDNGITAIVDYAHTPDALKNIIETLNMIRKGGERLIIVVGAGGNRDVSKRPEMAQEAVNGCDTVILTSDNPRFENPEDIINQMFEGIGNADLNKVLKITDRREAIRTACTLAKKGDFILVAGKGHETYQEIKGIKYPFDDREIINDFFEKSKNISHSNNSIIHNS